MNIHSASIKGLRDQNEDKHFIFLNSDKRDPMANNVNLFGIFDGHGGKEVSRFIHQNLPKYFLDKRITYPLSKKYIYDVYDCMQRLLKNQNYAYFSGSTALIVIHYKYNNDDYINVINLGDCRCVLCRDNFAMPLTKDHKPNWPEERHRIEKIGGKIIFDGFDWRIKDLSVSRSFGDLDVYPFISNKPDVFRYKLNKNDKFLVLACDGVWDVLRNEEVVNFILLNCYDNTTQNRINKNINIAKKLAEFALKKGSTDNITIIVVFFK